MVLTNAKLTKAQATKVSSTVHDAYARAIKPVHTSNDGDTVFLTRLKWDIDRIERDHPELKLTATKEMMV